MIGSCALAGGLRYRANRVLRYVAISVVLLAVILGGTRALFATVLEPEYRKDQVLTTMDLLDPDLRTPIVSDVTSPEGANGSSVLEGIRARRTLRVGRRAVLVLVSR